MFAIDETAITEARRLVQLGKAEDQAVALSGRTPVIFVTKNPSEIIALFEFNEQGQTYYIGIALTE